MSPQIEMANSAGGMETALFSLLSSSDPFYDRTPWFKPIGRGQYPLFHLSKSVNKDMFDQLFTQKIRIINQNGQLKGKMGSILDDQNEQKGRNQIFHRIQ